jgi:hypothetical protein
MTVFAPPCLKSPVVNQYSRPSSESIAGARFKAYREINPYHPREDYTLNFPGEPKEVADYIELIYKETRGGALPMTWQRPDGRGPAEFYFADSPNITQVNHRTVNVTVRLSRRIA